MEGLIFSPEFAVAAPPRLSQCSFTVAAEASDALLAETLATRLSKR